MKFGDKWSSSDASESSSLASRLTDLKSKRQLQPTMKFRVHIAHEDDDGMDSEYKQKEKERLQKQVAAIEAQLEKFDISGAADKVKKALQTELAHKKARLMEFGDE